ncbi:MAG: hypothetical protein ACREQA_01760, partial [Candidatus Binatia bacterium]
MEKRALIAIVLSLLILIIYQEWVTRQYGTPPPPEQEIKEKEKASAPLPKSQPKLQETRAI